MTEQNQGIGNDLSLESDTPINFKGRLLLTWHGIKTHGEYLSTKKDLTDEMTKIFVKGEGNVLLLEDSSGLMHADRDFAEGFNLFDSYVIALIYRSFKKQGQPSDLLTRERLLAVWTGVKGQLALNNAPNMSASLIWGTTVYEVVDELRGEGLDISIAFEKGVEPAKREVADPNTLDGYKIEWLAAYDWIKARDEGIAVQITDLVSATERPLNLFVIMGNSHVAISDKLPAAFKPNLEVSGNQFEGWDEERYGFRKQLMSRIQQGLPADDALWQTAFEETRKYG